MLARDAARATLEIHEGVLRRGGGEELAAAATEHALVDLEGRPRRIPSEHRARLAAAAPAARKPRS